MSAAKARTGRPSSEAVRLGALVRLALADGGAVYIELKCAGRLLGGADDVRLIVQLRRAGEVVMAIEHKAPGAEAARGFAEAMSLILGGRAFVEDRLEHARDEAGASKSIGQIGQDRIALAAHQDDVARALAGLIKTWVAERLGRPMRDDGAGFYTPSEWQARGEKYGERAVLVLVHDGSDLSPFCNYDYCAYEDIEAFSAFLGSLGYYCEDATGWYSGIYPVVAS